MKIINKSLRGVFKGILGVSLKLMLSKRGRHLPAGTVCIQVVLPSICIRKWNFETVMVILFSFN